MTERQLPVYLSLDQAADVMSLSTRTIRRRIADGTIPPTSAAGVPSGSASMTSKPPSAASPRPGGDPTMSEGSDSTDEAAEVIGHARATEQAIQQLSRATLARPSMTPADVDLVLAHLAAATAALPQVARQLGDILEQAKDQYRLEMDTLTETDDPDLAITTARLHLGAIREPAYELHRHLDAAHNETAHIAATDGTERRTAGVWLDIKPPIRRPEDHQPPPMGAGGGVPGPSR